MCTLYVCTQCMCVHTVCVYTVYTINKEVWPALLAHDVARLSHTTTIVALVCQLVHAKCVGFDKNHNVILVFLAGKLPNIRYYTVYILSAGQPVETWLGAGSAPKRTPCSD
jgi:hypothetical protein